MWLIQAAPAEPVSFRAVQSLPADSSDTCGIYLEGGGEEVAVLLQALRQQVAYAHLPVLVAPGVNQALPEALRALCDGEAETLEQARQRIASWRPDPRSLQGSVSSSALALARYLFLRPQQALQPQRDYTAHQVYRYPLLEAFADGEQPSALLRKLKQRGWIEQTELLDRLRCCDDCHSAHLNYIDVCPNCQSINVAPASFIHCFTCSHVAPQENFAAGNNLVCPNCNTRLRHIGADYNRPLEQLHCHDCRASFAEPLVIARCLACDRAHAPEKLPVLPIAAYQLSDTGQEAARLGMLPHTAANPSAQDLAPAAFISMTDWMMNLARRHGEAGFSLIGLHLIISSGLERQLGSAGLQALLDAFAARLQELMRDTDIVTRLGRRMFWMALPQTEEEGARQMLKKIQDFADGTEQEDGSRLIIHGIVHSAARTPREFNAEKLLKGLSQRLQGAIYADRTA